MKKNKGFTLIELLAIIVILAIIAVITVPIILNIIENSRMGAATDSAYGFKDSVNKYYVTKLSENHDLKLDGGYGISNGTMDIDRDGTVDEIPVSGEKASKGYLIYSNGVVTDGCLVMNGYEVRFTNGDATSTVKGDECAFELNKIDGFVFEDSEGEYLEVEDMYFQFEKYFNIVGDNLTGVSGNWTADFTMTNSIIGSFTVVMGVETDVETGDSTVTVSNISDANLNNIVTYTYNGEAVTNVQTTLNSILENSVSEGADSAEYMQNYFLPRYVSDLSNFE